MRCRGQFEMGQSNSNLTQKDRRQSFKEYRLNIIPDYSLVKNTDVTNSLALLIIMYKIK